MSLFEEEVDGNPEETDRELEICDYEGGEVDEEIIEKEYLAIGELGYSEGGNFTLDFELDYEKEDDKEIEVSEEGSERGGTEGEDSGEEEESEDGEEEEESEDSEGEVETEQLNIDNSIFVHSRRTSGNTEIRQDKIRIKTKKRLT